MKPPGGARVTRSPIILAPGCWLGAWAWDEHDMARALGHIANRAAVKT